MNSFGFENSPAGASTLSAPPTAWSELQVGQTLDGRFKILHVIDRGGMAEIYEARDNHTGHPVALKVPLSQFENNTDFLDRFQREETIGLTLEHPAILKFLWVGMQKSRPYIVTEYVKGETLAVRMLRQPRLTEAEAVRIASQICDGLDYLHRKGVVHRDLKPDNLMLCKDGTIRILDFGIARSAATRQLTLAGSTVPMGTPDYISPEQVQGKRGTAQSDIYAVGAMLYEMTTGVPPFTGDTPLVIMNARFIGEPEAPRKRNPELSRDTEAVILQALQRDPSRRFYTAAAMRARLNKEGGVSLWERIKGKFQV